MCAVSPLKTSAITQNRPTRVASGTLIPAEVCRLRGHGQCLEQGEETTSLSSGTAGRCGASRHKKQNLPVPAQKNKRSKLSIDTYIS